MPTKKKTAKRSPKELSPSRRRPEDKAIHILMPYILGIVALFFALCFILGEDKLGFLGWLSVFLTGLFSVGAWAFPLLLALHAIFYKRDLKAGSYLYKFWFTLGDMTFLGVLCAIFQGTPVSFSFAENYESGLTFSGGGAVGGLMYALLKKSVGVFTPVVALIALVVFSSFLFGKTPVELIRSVFSPMGEKWKESREERRDRQAEARLAREEEKLERARIRAEQIEIFPPEKKGKRRPLMESGEEVKERAPEDRVKDSEVHIRLPRQEEEELEKERLRALEEAAAREIRPIEEIESEPVPSLHDQIQSIFQDAPETETDLPWEEIEPDHLRAEIELKKSLSEKHGEEPVFSRASLEEEEKEAEAEYRFPPIELLQAPPASSNASLQEQQNVGRKLVETLESFGVKTTIIGISKGPTVTRYELQPQRGVRVKSIVNLTDDIALALAAGGVRIEAPIPGKEAVGIEVPNQTKETVFVRSLIESAPFREAKSRLNCSLGHDVAGKAIYCDLSKMPHILIAGATGMGKSVCLNSFIVSMLYHARPEEVQMILIDPKKVEMGKYNGIPHLLVPVVSDPKKAAGALNWAVIEMEKRFIEMEEVGVRDMASYNEITAGDPDRRPMSHIVIIIDELADLMMTARDEVETSICRIAQKARAAGMHLVIGTQRPSVDVITGLIKANVPSRIACTVASQVDSRTILDVVGAEKLLGRGDMLYAPVGAMKPMRVQGSFVSDEEVESVCDFLRAQRGAQYDESVSNLIEREAQKCGEKKKGAFSSFGSEGEGEGMSGLFADKDPLLEKAIEVAIHEKKIATSLLQRRLSVGYARAAKLIDFMAEMGIVGEFAGSKPREVLWTEEYYMEYKMRALEEQPLK